MRGFYWDRQSVIAHIIVTFAIDRGAEKDYHKDTPDPIWGGGWCKEKIVQDFASLKNQKPNYIANNGAMNITVI